MKHSFPEAAQANPLVGNTPKATTINSGSLTRKRKICIQVGNEPNVKQQEVTDRFDGDLPILFHKLRKDSKMESQWVYIRSF